MCGIAGKLYLDGQRPVERDLIERMLEVIVHRGPDGQGQYVSGPVGLGHRRLSIIDLSDCGTQPMCNEDATVWIAFNGEIYNYLELRKRLIQRGHVFRSATDTEVIIHLYEEYGADCLQQLRGMFAFAIWDQRRQRLFWPVTGWASSRYITVKPRTRSGSRLSLNQSSLIRQCLVRLIMRASGAAFHFIIRPAITPFSAR